MYRAYIRTFDGQISEKTNTTDQAAAALAFAELVGRAELDGQNLAAALTHNNRQLAFHRFDREPGDADYWRDRLDEIEWPQRGRPEGSGEGRTARIEWRTTPDRKARAAVLAKAAGAPSVSAWLDGLIDSN